MSNEQLYKLLAENEYLSLEQLKNAKETAASEQISLYEALVEKDFISDENLGETIAEFLKIPFVLLSKVFIQQDILTIVPEEIARRKKIIAFGQEKNVLKVATAFPENIAIIQLLTQKTGKPIQIYFATERDITNALRYYKKDLQEQFDKLLEKQLQITKTSAIKEIPITKLVDLLIEYAYFNKASDIHLEPRSANSLIRFRIDGVLHDVLILPKNLHSQVILRIKILSKLRTDEHFDAQDGKMQMTLDEETLDVRVSIIPVVQGEDAVLRLLSSKTRQFSLSDLGMANADLEKIKTNYKKPYGMILVTGPTGSGKTTTIYAILKILNTREKNIDTIEDPVEYEIKGINQIQVNPKTNLTFADGLRSLLRQDPDIIFVGEIRDSETADIAINSAMTGHLVVSTLHTNDAATAIPRFIDMKIEPFLVASTVNVIIGQRLVRKICANCRVSYTLKLNELIKLFPEVIIKKYFGETSEIRMYQGKGCSICHLTGYIGRVGIFEVLEITEKIRTLITTKVDSDVIRKKAIEEGMSTMFEDGLSKIQQGITTVEEVLRATKK